ADSGVAGVAAWGGGQWLDLHEPVLQHSLWRLVSAMLSASHSPGSRFTAADILRRMPRDPNIPDAFDVYTLVLLRRPADAPVMSDEELDALQARHLAYRAELGRQ